jgi:hypothetical protein
MASPTPTPTPTPALLTQTPRMTLPPTDTSVGTRAESTRDTTPIVLVLLSGAAYLVAIIGSGKRRGRKH